MPRPSTHVEVQRPSAHSTEETPSALHARPHAPQWSGLDASATSQPSFGWALQSSKPALHAKPHVPVEQVGTAFGRAGQALVQLPQWAGLVAVSTHCPSQDTCPPGHPLTHWPLLHTSLCAHFFGHDPQCPGSLWMSTHSLPHLAKPALQEIPQLPAWHHATPLAGTGQTCPQEPQSVALVVVSTHCPLQFV